ncbi:hypothetical protein AB833_02020 [Chromatiales bacterium (ex Bugula neritina AB1)]|nr:hypothetical protein AB833_02020 [Chromatiales bacterium (ex Bugula neritina AB1)]
MNLGIVIILFLFSHSAVAESPSWEKWEKDNSIARHGSFLVIDQPDEPFCYLKQSYYQNTNLMELARVKGNTRLTLPFLSGVEGDVIYWVDSGKKYSIPVDRYSAVLHESALSEMKAGNVLFVQVKPTGEKSKVQRFRLNGFTAAVKSLQDPKCSD